MAGTKELYPVFLDLEGMRCLVVGGGAVALRKVRELLACGACILVVSPALCPELASLAEARSLEWRPRPFREEDLDEARLVICATDDEEVNAHLARLARERGILVNVVDQPELGNFYVPAVVRRGPLTCAVSTGGTSPMLARRVKELLAEVLPQDLGDLAGLLGELRTAVKERLSTPQERRLFWEQVVTLELVRSFRSPEAGLLRRRVEECISSLAGSTTTQHR